MCFHNLLSKQSPSLNKTQLNKNLFKYFFFFGSIFITEYVTHIFLYCVVDSGAPSDQKEDVQLAFQMMATMYFDWKFEMLYLFSFQNEIF